MMGSGMCRISVSARALYASSPEAFDQAGCFRAAGIGVFKPASRTNRSARWMSLTRCASSSADLPILILKVRKPSAISVP